MIKKILYLLVIVCTSVVSQGALSLDDACKGFLYDISHNQPAHESLQLLKDRKDFLLHQFEGKTLLEHCADKLASSLREQKRLERDLENNPQDEDLHEKLMNATMKERLLGETFSSLLNLGKGDKAFEKSLSPFMEVWKQIPGYSSCVVMLQDVYPEIFPEQAEYAENPPTEDEDSDEEEPAFTQPSRESLLQAFKLQYFALKLSRREHNLLYSYPFTDKDLFERDSEGKSLLRHIADRWYAETPKTDDERKGIVRYRNGFYQSTWELQQRLDRCNEIQNLFIRVLNKTLEAIRLDPAHRQKPYRNLMDDLFEIEKNCGSLIESVKGALEKELDEHREFRKGTPAGAPEMTAEQVSAYEVSELFYALLEGDAELTNAFEIIKEKPHLVNACEPGGLSILHMVLLEYGHAWHKRKDLALFFDYLLLNGADANKTCTIQTEVTEIVRGAYSWSGTRIAKVVTQELPSVAELVIQPNRYAIPVLPEGHPFKRNNAYYTTAFSQGLEGEAAQFFERRLAKFTSGETARFETHEGDWLRDMMPEPPPVAEEKNESDDEEGDVQEEEQTEEEKKAFADLLSQDQQAPPQKSFWERWKPSLTYLAAGAATSGIAYWLGTRSWGDPHEERRQERQRVRAARV